MISLEKVAILDDYQKVALNSADWNKVAQQADITVFDYHIGDEDAVAKDLEDYTIICCMRERTKFPESLISRLPNLKLLITSGAKNASIDMVAAKKHDVIVCGTQSPGHAAAELAWGLIMSLTRNIHIEDKATREGQWQTTIGTDLKGLTFGVLGLGRHGENVTRYAKAFGMKVVAWSQNLTEERCKELDVELLDKKTFFKTADVISVHLKMGQRNIDVVSTPEFDLMKPTAYIVNTSRGPIINEKAMIEALKSEKIAGAGLDVYDIEPMPKDHPLLTTKNTLLTSHIGFVTKQTYEVFYGQTVEAIEAWLEDEPVRVLN